MKIFSPLTVDQRVGIVGSHSTREMVKPENDVRSG